MLLWPLLTQITLAQEAKYIIKFKSGFFLPADTPQKNIDRVFDDALVFGEKTYVLIQFHEIPGREAQLSMKQDGITLLEYIPNYAYFASAPSEITPFFLYKYKVRALETIDFRHKTDPRLSNGGYANSNLVISYFTDIPYMTILETLKKAGLEFVSGSSIFKRVTIKFPRQGLNALDQPWVMWIEPVHPELATQNFGAKTDHRSNVLGASYSGARNLQGNGVNIGQWDVTGVGPHIDFGGRLVNIQGISSATNAQHPTHVAGTLTGAGIKNPASRGMAPGATLYTWNYSGDITQEMDSAARFKGVVITQNAYAYSTGSDNCNIRGQYDATSRDFDRLAILYPQVAHVFAAGNFQTQCGQGGYRTLSSGYQSSKNVIVVGAVTKMDAMSTFSSWGPVQDGRLKPDITAVGAGVLSTFPADNYQPGWNGTSMSSPGVSGTLAQLYQRYRQLKSGYNPDGILMKAIICNSADDQGNPGPDFKYGFGRLNALNAVKTLENNRYMADSVAQGGKITDSIFIANGTRQLKVLLAWNDKETASNASPALVNDLDLVVKLGDISFTPWVLDTANKNNSAVRGIDSINNMEQITINNPAEGYCIFKVSGTSVPFGTQKYVVTYEIIKDHITVTYPNGGETIAPPSSSANSQIIRWDAAGVSGNFTAEYSLDGGNNWNLLSNSIPSTQHYYNWSNASDSLQSKLARIRIKSGTLSDVSDTNFHIMGVSTALYGNVCDRQVFLGWNEVFGATSYNIYQLANNAWTLKGTSNDTFFTATGLVNSNGYWFTVAAIGSNEAAGEKCIAIFKTPANSIYPPTVMVQPQNKSACAGSSVTFKSRAGGTPVVNIQWQQSTDNGSTWSDLSGRNDTALTISNISYAQNNYHYRAGFRNSCLGWVYSKAAALKVDTGQTITMQPSDNSVCTGRDAIFSTKVSGVDTPAVQWQRSMNTANVWTDIPGANSTVLKIFKVEHVQNHSKFRMNAFGSCSTVTSGIAELIVREPLQVILPGNQTTCSGKPVVISAKGSGGDSSRYSYRWSNAPGNGSTITVTPTVTTVYKVTITDSCSAEASDSITITVLPALTIKVSNDTTICNGNQVVLTASGTGGTAADHIYTWQPGNITGRSLSVNPSSDTKYFVTLGDNCSAQSVTDSVMVAVRPELKVTAPADTVICLGQSLNLTARAEGGIASSHVYSWDRSTVKTPNLSVSPRHTTTYSIKVEDKCSPASHDSVTVSVRPALSVAYESADTSGNFKVCAAYNIKAKACGGDSANHTYTWKDAGSKVVGSGPVLAVSTIANGTYYLNVSDKCSAPVQKKINLTKEEVNSSWTYIQKGLKTVIFHPADSGMALYKWDFGDDAMSLQSNPSHTYQKYASFRVCYTATKPNGCSNTTCTSIELTPTGVKEKDSPEPGIIIYPNPNEGVFEIKINRPELKNLHICVYNLMGEEVANTKIVKKDESLYSVNVGEEAAGIYFVHISDNDFTLNKRIIINNIR
jgi:hypothetical protein